MLTNLENLYSDFTYQLFPNNLSKKNCFCNSTCLAFPGVLIQGPGASYTYPRIPSRDDITSSLPVYNTRCSHMCS